MSERFEWLKLWTNLGLPDSKIGQIAQGIQTALKSVVGFLSKKNNTINSWVEDEKIKSVEDKEIKWVKLKIVTNTEWKKCIILGENISSITSNMFIFDEVSFEPNLEHLSNESDIYYKWILEDKKWIFFVWQEINRDNINKFLMENMWWLFIDEGLWVFNNDDNLHYKVWDEIKPWNWVNKIMEKMLQKWI